VTLISARELAARLDDPDLRIADVRWYLGQPGAGRRAYEAGHIPGAMFMDLDIDLSAPPGPGRHPLPDPGTFAARLGELGIGSAHRVVVYDDVNGTVAARLWWMLDDLGHRDVSLLDGGLAAWVAIGGTLTSYVPGHPPARLELADRWGRVMGRDEVNDRLGKLVLLDLRVGERYRGETEPVDPVPGHIPTARSMPAGENLRDDGRFLAPAALESRYRELGAGEEPAVVYCGSGVTACHAAVAMREAGLPPPILYPGSYSDWTRAGMPVATGSEPGEPRGG
jgi:thiosulfate/3-mercaptopyruvate sulfurtransferase